MSRFFVGQRVRMVRPNHAENSGKTGRIRALIPERMGTSTMINCDVSWDVPMDATRFHTRTHTSRLEPILDPPEKACEDEFKHDLDKLLEGLPA